MPNRTYGGADDGTTRSATGARSGEGGDGAPDGAGPSGAAGAADVAGADDANAPAGAAGADDPSGTADTPDTVGGADATDAPGSADTPGTVEGADTPDAGVVLRGEGIEKSYGSRLPVGRTVEVLTGADLTVRAGEVVGIVGENGSGKSTLMEVLVGALDADAGSVSVSGRVGWCPQEDLLYDRLTVRETFGLFGEAYGMDGEAVASARDRLAERLGFGEFLDYRIDRLSGGNRRKVSLAVALMHDPDVLLLDEPYTGFDWETYLAFWELTAALTDRGTAVVIISHLINERERFDRVYELADGTLTDVTGEGSSQAGDGGVR